MQVIKQVDKIIVEKTPDFDIADILECGQVFSYKKNADGSYVVVSCDKTARIYNSETSVVIETAFVDYFYNFFDLSTDYGDIKNKILKIYPNFSKFMQTGRGIRILRQDVFQTIIGFIVSANNNIKRIKAILGRICAKFGDKITDDLYTFPTPQQLSQGTERDFFSLGAGYRSKYLQNSVSKLLTPEFDVEYLKKLSTAELKKQLQKLDGVGPKVADCILLFGFARTNVFPVDTWIEKAYYMFEKKTLSRDKIAEYFVNLFGNYSGYAQQYLYNFMITE